MALNNIREGYNLSQLNQNLINFNTPSKVFNRFFFSSQLRHQFHLNSIQNTV